ncbi:MAG: alpha/beta fold hydrolase, partial [Ilumatobacteraceae bacterium]
MRTPLSPAVRALAVTAVLALTAVACGDDNPTAIGSEAISGDAATAPLTDTSSSDTTGTGPATTDTTLDADGVGAIDWQPFGDGVETGSLDVPVDYQNPEAGTFDLYVARHLAMKPDERIGSLLVNPGGPGFGGSDFAVYAEQIYSQTLLDHFDIIGWDPRGTGLTAPAVDCVDDYDRYYASTDITPDDDAERQQIIDLAQEFQDACAAKNTDIIDFVGTNNTARDMDSIRRALGEDTISYFGFSYGSELGATWATLFPDTVRAAVLDGAADPTADFVTSGLQQTAGFEKSLDTFLARCSANAACLFNNGGNAESAFDTLMQTIDDNPIPSAPDRPNVTRGVALNGVAQAMYSETLWPELEQALAEAQAGDGTALLALHDAYFQRQADGTYDNSLEAFQTISCMDQSERPTVEEEDATAPRFTE